MLTLLGECHFWTIGDDEIKINSNDYGAFQYERKHQHNIHTIDTNSSVMSLQAKRDYNERRGGVTVVKNSRKRGRLKGNIKKLEELLRQHKIVHSQWRDAAQVILLFANGIIAHICVDLFTGDILRMVFEKYFVGKLATDTIGDAFFTCSNIVLAYNTNQLTVVHLTKPNRHTQGPAKVSNMEPRIFHIMVPGSAERKLVRHLAVNTSTDLFVMWTKSSQNEVFPWRPTIRDQDRANIHVFRIKGAQLQLLSYCWSENDPLCVDFLRASECQIIAVEQKVSRKGELSAEVCSYEVNTGKMQRSALSSITVSSQVRCLRFSPDQEKLFLGTEDSVIYLHDLVSQSTKVLGPIEVVPTLCSWHSDSSLIMVGNEHARLQCFDLALTRISDQLQSDDVAPADSLDLSHYFVKQPNLVRMSFSQKPDITNFCYPYAQTDCFVLLLFDNGPIACLRFIGGAGMRGDIHNSGLTADVIVDQYVALNQLQQAVNLLTALNWETYGAMCLISLHKIANHVFLRGDAKRERIELMMTALQTFSDSLSDETKDEFSDQVYDLKRRFFFYLLRNNLFSNAFEVAQDIEDYDLFMDLFNVTKCDPALLALSTASFSQAAVILQEENQGNASASEQGNDYRTESACSVSYSESGTVQSQKQTGEHHLKNYVPPLPSLKAKVFKPEMPMISIPKPELRIDSHHIAASALPVSASVTPGSVTGDPQQHTLKTPASNFAKSMASDRLPINCAKSPSIQWMETPHQTLGIPTVPHPADEYSSISRLPQASTMSVTNAPYLHYATPAVITEHVWPQVAQRNYQQMPLMPTNTYQPKFYQHPLVSRSIPHTMSSINDDLLQRHTPKKPPASILANSMNTQNGNCENSTSNIQVNSRESIVNIGGAKSSGTGEKNKVKFSDTVQVAMVPEIPRKEKPNPSKRSGYARPSASAVPSVRTHLTNPKKELADSLPLCHPHDDYLKDFNPLSPAETVRPSTKPTNFNEDSSQISVPPAAHSSIKVVHFGIV